MPSRAICDTDPSYACGELQQLPRQCTMGFVLLVSVMYYVYVLSRPDGTPFYVGKGQKTRVHAHEKEAKRDCQCHKCRVIRKIWREGGEVQKNIVFTTNDEALAYDYERELISQYGRKSLTNRCDGGMIPTNFDADSLARKSASLKKTLSDPAIRAKRADNMRRLMSNPEKKARMMEAQKRSLNSPQSVEKRRAIAKAAANTPAEKERRRMSATKQQSNPEMKERHAKAVRAAMTPEWREKQKRILQERNRNPTVRIRNQTIEENRRATLSAKATERYKDPAARANQSEHMKMVWENRRQAKAQLGINVCKHGHTMTEENRYYSDRGLPKCKTCTLNYQASYRARKKAAK